MITATTPLSFVTIPLGADPQKIHEVAKDGDNYRFIVPVGSGATLGGKPLYRAFRIIPARFVKFHSPHHHPEGIIVDHAGKAE